MKKPGEDNFTWRFMGLVKRRSAGGESLGTGKRGLQARQYLLDQAFVATPFVRRGL
jgi:hypothetical protein